jgi:hypothetical protein
VLLDTGVDTFAATGIQFGRIARTGEASVWGSTKPFPGVTGAPLERGYEIFTVDSGVFPFLQISLDDPTAGLYMAAYRDSFHPSNLPPNYGLDINYLGDPGSSQPFGNPSFFQIQVAPRTQVMIPINEVTPGGGAGRPFELIVEGFLDSSFGDVPEPGSWALFAGGAVGLLALRARASRRRSRKEPRV